MRHLNIRKKKRNKRKATKAELELSTLPNITEQMVMGIPRASMPQAIVSREPLLHSKPPSSPPPRHSSVPYSNSPIQVPPLYSSLTSLNPQCTRSVHPFSLLLHVSNKEQRLKKFHQPPTTLEMEENDFIANLIGWKPHEVGIAGS